MTSIERVRQYRERQKQLKALQQQSPQLDQQNNSVTQTINNNMENNNQQLVIENNERHLSISTPLKSSSTNVIPTPKFSKKMYNNFLAICCHHHQTFPTSTCYI